MRPVATPAAQLATPLALAAAPPSGDAQRGSSAKAFNRSEVARAIRANFDSLVRASPLPRVRPGCMPASLRPRHVCKVGTCVHLYRKSGLLLWCPDTCSDGESVMSSPALCAPVVINLAAPGHPLGVQRRVPTLLTLPSARGPGEGSGQPG